jgi:hypothetical protein
MKVDPQVANEFFGDPPVGWPYVSVMVGPTTAAVSKPPCIPLDGRTYDVYGTINLSTGQSLQARFRLNTTGQQPIESLWWHVESDWYEPYDQEALRTLGISQDVRPTFTWAPYVALCTVDEPPYREDQALFPAPAHGFRAYLRVLLRRIIGPI